MSITSFSTHLLVAICFGLGVAFLILFWITDGDGTLDLNRDQYLTRKRIQQTVRALDDWKARYKKHLIPSSSAALKIVGKDRWGYLLRYSLVNSSPLIESLGRDGVRGGVGLDCDFSNRNLHPAQERLTRLQQLTDPIMRSGVSAVLLCALLAGVLVFRGLQSEETRPRSWLELSISLSVAFVVAVFGVFAITIAHISSGH